MIDIADLYWGSLFRLSSAAERVFIFSTSSINWSVVLNYGVWEGERFLWDLRNEDLKLAKDFIRRFVYLRVCLRMGKRSGFDCVGIMAVKRWIRWVNSISLFFVQMKFLIFYSELIVDFKIIFNLFQLIMLIK